MKRLFLIMVFFPITFYLSYSGPESLSPVNIGFFLGMSTPNENLNDVYNSQQMTISTQSLVNFFRRGMSSGYHIGMKARVNLSERFVFVGGLAYNRFPETTIEVRDPTNNSLQATLAITQNIVPISAGVNIYLLKNFIGIYGVGELQYNYINSSVNITKVYPIDLPISTTPTDNRAGFGIGAGTDINLVLTRLNIEFRYNNVNLIGKKSGELQKVFYTLSLGVFF